MNTLLLYQSKYGATKLYAEWIKDEFPDVDIAAVELFDPQELDNYHRIVIGSRTYMGRITIQTFLEHNWDRLHNKELYLFTVGMVPPQAPDSIKSYELIPEYIR